MKLGVAFGICLAVPFMLWGLILELLGGSRQLARHAGVSFSVLEATYLTAGVVAGCLFGCFRPLARTWWGAAILGFVVSFVLYGAFGIAMYGVSWGLSHLPSLWMTWWGPIAGVVLWYRFVYRSTGTDGTS